MPKMFIIAGPNGSGKSVFAQEFLPNFVHCRQFVNADLIALGLSPFDPVKVRLKAGRLLLTQIKELIHEKQDFGFESTLAGKSYVPLIKKSKQKGYSVHIFFLWVPNVLLAKARIKQRVQNGGHDVPTKDIERRFIRSQRNFIEHYRNLCDTWIVFDNSSSRPKEIAKYNSEEMTILDQKLYNQFEYKNDSQTKK